MIRHLRIWIIAGIVICGATGGILLIGARSGKAPEPVASDPSVPLAKASENMDPGRPVQAGGATGRFHPPAREPENGTDGTEKLARAIVAARLHAIFAGDIRNPRTQLAAIEKLVRFLKKRYPESWADHVSAYLVAAFPERADQLYERYQLLTEFKRWMSDNRALIMDMPPDKRREYIWRKRVLFFGQDAYAIWAAEKQDQAVSDVLNSLGARENAPFSEKRDHYADWVETIYQAPPGTYTPQRKQALLDRFLSLENVQADLRSMRPEKRRRCLKGLRQSMGMDVDAIDRWEELDRIRDKRWSRGRQYMERREQIVEKFSGDDLARRLDDLRRQCFGPSAETIENEESAGFFRFEQERMYGKN